MSDGRVQMRFQLLYGVAVLLVLIPALLLGVSNADSGGLWPPSSDLRYRLIVVGLVVLIATRVVDEVRKRRRV